jgi:hypothetical protein
MIVTITDQHLEAAVAKGILSTEQVARLRELAGSVATDDLFQPAVVDPDDERFRLIGGFNDVFVTIGVLLLVSALIGLASALGFALGFTLIALVAGWGLSEIFARRMRLALPSIVLAVMFACAGAFLATTLAHAVMPLEPVAFGKLSKDQQGLYLLFFGVGMIAAAGGHFWRFRVPIDVAILAVGVMCMTYGVLLALVPAWAGDSRSLVFGSFGILAFIAALRVDASDPRRLTRRSDMAFWLHLLAAPLIVHAIIPFVGGSSDDLGMAQAVSVLLIFAVLGLVALVIDRRALLVSALSYTGIAIAYLLSQSVAEEMQLSLTLLGLAVLVLGLSVGWRSLRRVIVPGLPLGSLRNYIPSAT